MKGTTMKMSHTQFFFVCSNDENKVVGKVFVPNEDIRKRFNEMYSNEFYISKTEIPFYQLRSFKDYSIVKYKMTRRIIETNVGFYFISIFKVIEKKKRHQSIKIKSPTINRSNIMEINKNDSVSNKFFSSEREEQNRIIKEFQGEYRWLSNFWPVNIELDGIIYPSVEHAFMSSKSNDEEWKRYCSNVKHSPASVKYKSRYIKVLPTWNSSKIEIMKHCLIQKYNQEWFRTKLLETENKYLQEGNMWSDKYWGVCLKTNKGSNHLGILIMEIRDSLKQNYRLAS